MKKYIYLLLVFIIALNFPIFSFLPLPINAVNGNWSYISIDNNHSLLFDDINSLKENSDFVIRALVEEINIFEFARGDTQREFFEVYVYTLRILDFYQGFTSRDTIEFLQLRRVGGRESIFGDSRIRRRSLMSVLLSRYGPSSNRYIKMDYITLDFGVGEEEFIFFLREINNVSTESIFSTFSQYTSERGNRSSLSFFDHYLNRFFVMTNPIQSSYKYLYLTDSFESVNPYNNLKLILEH